MLGPKRAGQEDVSDRSGPPDPTGLAFGTLRAGDSAADKPAKSDDEKMSLFWRVFGGTILSIATLIAITLFNNLAGTLSEIRSDIARANESRAAAVTELRAELAKAAEARADLIRKDEFNSRLTNNWERLQTLQQQNNGQNATMLSIKTELDGLKERLAKHAADVDGVRKDTATAVDAGRKEAVASVDQLKKEQSAVTETLKKDVAALDLIREKLATAAADLKASRDDLMRLRADVDRNQAYDMERKERRDAQYKQIEETFKELQKGLQDCREKIARLEGQSITPAGGASPTRNTAVPPKPEPPAQKD